MAQIWLALTTVTILISAAFVKACPDYKANNGCNGGPCIKGGVKGRFRIPSNCPLLEGYGTGVYHLTGTLPDDTQIPGTKVKVYSKRSAAKCCLTCKKKRNCRFWQWLNLGAYGGICFTYNGHSGPVCTSNVLVKTRVGAKCMPTVNDDPHFVGAHGTHYDFSGSPNKTFCLLTDTNLHVNVKLTGYLDNRTDSASLLQGGKAVRTWIKEVGILWFKNGEEHKVHLVARGGKETSRKEGYLARAEVDSVPIPQMAVGTRIEFKSGLILKLEGIEKKGNYDVDFYSLRIGEILDMAVRLRVANPLLQTPEDAETHMSLSINHLETTPAIHGILGQTYREDHAGRAEMFSDLGAVLKRNIAADGESGKGFLDGTPSDYLTSDVLITDCHFSQYQPPAGSLVLAADLPLGSLPLADEVPDE